MLHDPVGQALHMPTVREACQAAALLVMRILADSASGQWTGGSGPGVTLTQH
jgi:hypothetical protein